MKHKPRPISQRHLQVIDSFFENGFDKKAALKSAGYSALTSEVSANTVFYRDDVKSEIARRRAELDKKYEVNQDWVIRQLAKRAMAGETLARFKKIDEKDGALTWDFRGAGKEDLALISELCVEYYTEGRGEGNKVEVKKFRLKEPDVQAALMALGRHFGAFTDKIEISGSLADRIETAHKQARPRIVDNVLTAIEN